MTLDRKTLIRLKYGSSKFIMNKLIKIILKRYKNTTFYKIYNKIRLIFLSEAGLFFVQQSFRKKYLSINKQKYYDIKNWKNQ